MAVENEKPGASGQKPPQPAPKENRSAPGWLLWLYLGGLVLVYIGERVLSGLEKGAGVVTGAGVLAVVAATLLRFAPRFRAGGERRSIETLLAALSLAGLLGLALYGLTTPWSVQRFFETMAEPKRLRLVEFLTVAWVAMIVLATLPMVFAETALRPMRNSEHPESRRVRAAAGAGLTLALAAVYGALFVYAASGVKLDVDFSYFKTSRPSESTKQLAKSLSDPVKVVAFFPQVSDVRSEVARYLNELKASSPKLQVEIQDRLLAPKLARELRATQDGAIVLSRGTTTQTLQIGTELEKAKPKLKTLDRDFQEQLTKLAKSRRTAYLTVGHGELNDAQKAAGAEGMQRAATIVRTLLQRQNYLVKDLGLAQGLGREIPNDADLVLVLGPTEPFLAEEIAGLRSYLARGGKLFLALDADAFSTRDIQAVVDSAHGAASASPSAAPAPTPPASASAAGSAAPATPPPARVAPLNDLAALVGLEFNADVLANDKAHVTARNDASDRTWIVSQSFSSHASVSTLSRSGSRSPVVLVGAGSLEKPRGSSAQIDFAMRAPSGTFADRNRNYEFDRASEKQTTYNVAAAVTGDPTKKAEKSDEKDDDKKDPHGKKDDKKDPQKSPNEMRAFVLADSDLLSDFVVARVLYNQILFVDAVRWLVGEESTAGPPNTEEDQRMTHTKQQDLTRFYATIFGAPALVLAAGLFLSRRSRRPRPTSVPSGAKK
ncbi:MAG TPA: Gldg family protein [Polyangiaceae bacterium]